MKNFLKLLILFFSAAFLFLINFNPTVYADTACGPGSTCTGSNAYLAPPACDPGTFAGDQCRNRNPLVNYNVSCPVGGGPGSCVGFADNKDGCLMYDTITVWQQYCTLGYGDCDIPGSACGPPTNPYGGTCVVTSHFECETTNPLDGDLGCCLLASPTPSPSASPPGSCPGTCCDVSLTPASATMNTGGATQGFTAAVSNVEGGSVTSVTFSSSNTSVLTMSPSSDPSSPYQSTGTSTSTVGNSTVTARVYVDGSLSCSDTSTVTTGTTSTCDINLFPSSVSTSIGNTSPPTLTASVTAGGGATVSNVQFFTSNANIAYPNPLIDPSSPYESTVTAVANGSATFTAVANLSDGQTCSDTSTVTVGSIVGMPTCDNLTISETISSGSTVPISCIVTDNSGIDRVTMHYVSYPQGNYCTAPWSNILNQNPGGNFNTTRGDLTLVSLIPLTWEASWTWDTTGVPNGQYVISGNVFDDSLNWCTGNPSGTCGVADAQCPNCNALTEIGACTPSCLTMCGQDDGCGGTCPNTDATAPSAPTISSPSAGNYNMTGLLNVSINLTDNSPTLTDSFEVKVYRQDHPSANSPWLITCGGDTNQAACSSITGTNATYIPRENHNNNVRIAVRAVNSTCSINSYSNWVTRDIDLTGNVSGTFYLDDNNNASVVGNICQDPDSPPAQGLSGTMTVTDMEDPAGDHKQTLSGSSYSVLNVPYYPSSWTNPNMIADLDILNLDPSTTYVCTCPGNGDCSYGGISAPQSGVNFFVIPYNLSANPWWQVFGGNIYGRNSYVSQIPSSCTAPGCDPFLSTQDTYDSDKSGGVPLTQGGNTIDAGSGGFTDRTPDTLEPVATNTNLSSIPQEGYSFFAQRFNLADSSTVTQITGGTQNDEPIPVAPIQDDVFVFYSNGSLSITPSSEWNIDGGEKKVIFVNGDITFNGPGNSSTYEMIDVEDGSFIAFIASGDIIFDSEVGNPNPAATLSNVDGIYIADGRITIDQQSLSSVPDNKFIGYGSFIGWSGVELPRNYDDGAVGSADNADYPTEQFIFNPNLITAFPEALSRPSVTWQEVN